MGYKILYLGTTTEKLTNFSQSSMEITGIPFDKRVPHLEYEFYEHIALNEIIREVVEAEKNDFDAAVIGCFYDPGLRESKELVEMPVIGACEASLIIAGMLTAGQYSILVGRKKWIPKMLSTIKSYGTESKIASWRSLDLTVPMMRDYKTTIDSIMREGKRAIEEDNAECLILGCTGMIGQAGEAQKNLCVPVLDPVMCGIKVAEMRADLWRNYGISHSKRGGFEAPPKNELKNIFESYYGKNK